MAIKPIQILINAKDDASAVFDKLQTKVAAVGVAILGYFGIQAFAGVVKGAADLEGALSRVKAATGASAAEMKQLRDAAEAAGSNTKFTAVEAAGALENLAKAGLTAKDAIATLPAVLQLAQAGDIELATAAEFVTKAVNGMGLAFSDAGRVADVLAKGANATNTSVTGLAQALSYAAPLANTLGLSLETTVAMIGKFADAGIDASRAGTALNSIMAQFSDPASKFRQELAAAGITTTNFDTALHQLAKSGPAGERAIAAVGQEAGPALRALLNQGIGKLDELVKALQNAKGSAAETASVMEQNLNGALSGLATAWGTVKNALGTPVLPVLQQAVDKLSGSLKAAVADGTVAKFGAALATGFQSAITWASNFVASFNVDMLVARLQTFATETQQTFERVGQWATNAGNLVKVAYGVMAGGTNVVLAVVYKVGEAFAGVASNIQAGLSLLATGLSKISFGSVSASFKQAADEIRVSAGATWAASEELSAKASAAFDAAADAARIAQGGFAGLAGTAEEAGTKVASTSGVIASVAAELATAGDAATAASERTGAASAKQAAAADQARASIGTLRAEYQKAIDTGNFELAVKKLDEIKAASNASASSAKDHARAQKEAAADIAAAFQRAGVQTKDALKVAATTALSDFEKVRDSGQATASGIATAWKRAAEAAIEAADGVAPAWVQAQAGMQGFELAADQAGKATLRIKDASTDATSAANGLATALDRVKSAREADIEAREKALDLAEREAALERKRRGVDGSGFAADATGGRIVAGSDLMSLTGIAAFLKNAGVDDDKTARNIAREFADANGNVTYMGNAGQKKYGGDTISVALLKAAERYTFGIGTNGEGNTPSTIPKPESTRTVRVDLNLNGQSYGSLNTDTAGADMLQQLLSQLGQARGTAG